jgi:hypothetical protein
MENIIDNLLIFLIQLLQKPFIQMENIFQVFTVSAEEFQNDENPILEQEQTGKISVDMKGVQQDKHHCYLKKS